MTEKQMISKYNEFIEECACMDGFTTYSAYEYIFGDADFKERILEDGRHMSTEGFREWLSDYMWDYRRKDYECLNIEGACDDIYTNVPQY